MFRRKPSKDPSTVAMRKALYEMLWEATHQPTPYFDKDGEIKVRHSLPMPDCDLRGGDRDDWIQLELKKILG